MIAIRKEDNGNSSSDKYQCQLQCCNVLLTIFGLIFLVLSLVQFWDFRISNNQQLDLQITNVFQGVVGLIGLYCVVRQLHTRKINFLLILYLAVVVLGVSTTLYYAFDLVKLVNAYQRVVQNERIPGFIPTAEGNSQTYIAKIVISSTTVGVGILSTIVAIVGFSMVGKLAKNFEEEESRPSEKNFQAKFVFITLLKIFVALIMLICAIFLEYQRHYFGIQYNNAIKVALDGASGVIAIASAFIDFYTLSSPGKLSLKMSCVFSIITATWCIKSIDNNMFPSYKNDINAYRIANSLNEIMLPGIQRTSPQRTIILVHGLLIALLSILTFLCAISAIFLSPLIYSTINFHVSRETTSKQRFFNISHIFWAIFLLVLSLVGMFDIPWNGDFIGSDLFWIVILFVMTGSLCSSNYGINTLVKFVLNIICFSISLEKACVSINLIYQSATHSSYRNENVTDRRAFIAQIILHSLQCIVFFGSTFTSTMSIMLSGQELCKNKSFIQKSNIESLMVSLGAIAYGTVFIVSYVCFEIEKWTYTIIAFETPFYRIANGPLAFTIFIMQILAYFRPQLTSAVIILQIILCSLALFVVSSTMTCTKYITFLMRIREPMVTILSEHLILMIALIVAAIAVIVCFFTIACGLFYLMRNMESNRRKERPVISASEIVSAPQRTMETTHQLREEPPLSARQLPTQYVEISEQDRPPPSSSLHQISILPIEEQTLYWSAEEDPNIYKASRKLYYYSPNTNTDSAYYSSYASPLSIDDSQSRITTILEKPPRAGRNVTSSETQRTTTTSDFTYFAPISLRST